MKIKLSLVTSNLFFAEVFLARQIRRFERDFDLNVMINATEAEFREGIRSAAPFTQVRIARKIELRADIASLLQLIGLFRRLRPDVVHSTTPKAGLLTMLAGLIARVPVRIHTFTGQVWQTRTGPMRWLLKVTDRITAWAATCILVDGKNQLHYLLEHGVVDQRKAQVLGQGSICGVDTTRFRPDSEARLSVRQELGLADRDFLVVYMARLTVDKGAVVMAKAFVDFVTRYSGNAYLLMIGPDEEDLTAELQHLLHPVKERSRLLGYTRVPERYIAAADAFCLPSYREGFPMVLLNAAACGVTAVASRIHGSTDAIVDEQTGLLHEAGDVTGLADILLRLADDENLRNSLGRAARARVQASFSEAAVMNELSLLYQRLHATTSFKP